VRFHPLQSWYIIIFQQSKLDLKEIAPPEMEEAWTKTPVLWRLEFLVDLTSEANNVTGHILGH
jgi:hypothetical protein